MRARWGRHDVPWVSLQQARTGHWAEHRRWWWYLGQWGDKPAGNKGDVQAMPASPKCKLACKWANRARGKEGIHVSVYGCGASRMGRRWLSLTGPGGACWLGMRTKPWGPWRRLLWSPIRQLLQVIPLGAWEPYMCEKQKAIHWSKRPCMVIHVTRPNRPLHGLWSKNCWLEMESQPLGPGWDLSWAGDWVRCGPEQNVKIK